jgi:hypothetical protein
LVTRGEVHVEREFAEVVQGAVGEGGEKLGVRKFSNCQQFEWKEESTHSPSQMLGKGLSWNSMFISSSAIIFEFLSEKLLRIEGGVKRRDGEAKVLGWVENEKGVSWETEFSQLVFGLAFAFRT